MTFLPTLSFAASYWSSFSSTAFSIISQTTIILTTCSFLTSYFSGDYSRLGWDLHTGFQTVDNNNSNNHDDIYCAVIMTRSL